MRTPLFLRCQANGAVGSKRHNCVRNRRSGEKRGRAPGDDEQWRMDSLGCVGCGLSRSDGNCWKVSKFCKATKSEQNARSNAKGQTTTKYGDTDTGRDVLGREARQLWRRIAAVTRMGKLVELEGVELRPATVLVGARIGRLAAIGEIDRHTTQTEQVVWCWNALIAWRE